jgi:hypothetical protein
MQKRCIVTVNTTNPFFYRSRLHEVSKQVRRRGVARAHRRRHGGGPQGRECTRNQSSAMMSAREAHESGGWAPAGATLVHGGGLRRRAVRVRGSCGDCVWGNCNVQAVLVLNVDGW